MNHRAGFLLTLIAAAFVPWMAPVAGDPVAPPPAKEGNKYALLVGVTKYANLPERFQLEGPANDVVLMRKLLVDRFGFALKSIATLADPAGSDQPTYRNIKREVERLATIAKSGDQIVILLSGQGTQLPDQDPPQIDDPEPDGLDEAFLPSDSEISPDRTSIPNAIRDDDLRRWFASLVDKGTYICLIVDCGWHTTVRRAADTEKPRQVRPQDLGVGEAELAAARLRASRLFDPSRRLLPVKLGDLSHRLIVFYACLPDEEAIEVALPPGSSDAKPCGLLTYALCNVLAESRDSAPPTYEALIERIHDQYRKWGRTYPNPQLEGTGPLLKHPLLNAEAWRTPPVRVRGNMTDGWKLDAGRLHGLTDGSILAVSSEKTGTPAGHVKITQALTTSAKVIPFAFAMQPAPADLPSPGRAEPVYIDYGDLRLRVAVAERTADGKPVAEADRQIWGQELRMIAEQKNSLVRAVDNPSEAEWLVSPEQRKVFLIPSEGVVIKNDKPAGPAFGPFAGNAVSDNLTRIATIRNLLRLAGDDGLFRTDAGVRLQIELIRYRNPDDREGQVVDWAPGKGRELRDGEIIAFRVHNRSQNVPIYVTLLFISSSCEITAVYPSAGELVERLPQGKTFTTAKLRMRGDTTGLEHVLAIAVKADGPPVDFTWLEQKDLKQALRVALVRGDKWLEGPLGRLFQTALFGEGNTRGLERGAAAENYAISVLSWRTVAKPAEPEKK